MAACFLGAGTLLAEVFASLNYPKTTHEKITFGVTGVEVRCCVEQSEPSHRPLQDVEACISTVEKAVPKINSTNTFEFIVGDENFEDFAYSVANFVVWLYTTLA